MEEQLKSIIKDKHLPKSMDYQLLRKEAIASTQQISGDNWTDYNIHDPGVTILEQFCYALTDIAYRTNLNIETLLFHGGNPEQIIRSNALYPPGEIFPTSPITLSDYRILILDHFPDKISNCWINTITDHKEGIQGLYDIILLLKSDVNSSEYVEIKNAVRKLFISHRNLCEDINDIRILYPERICITAEIDIYQDEDAEDILAEILFEVEFYFNPSVHFYSLEELEQNGWTMDQIFDIPSFKHGFITPEQLHAKPKEFYVSKIADHILKVKGVRGLHNLSVTQDGIPIHGDTIIVEDHKYLTLGLLQEDEVKDRFKGFNITIFKGGVINNYLKSAVIYSLEIREAKSNRNYEIQTKSSDRNKTKIKTSELTSYESIQNSFPGIYGVGDYTPAKEEGSLRLAQSSQLKAYLMFFDQILANHLAQLSKLSELFSIENIDAQKVRTYFTQLLSKNTSGAPELLKQKLPAKSTLLNRQKELEANRPTLDSVERQELDSLVLDIREKDAIVRQLINKAYDSLMRLSEDQLKRSRKFNNREIIHQFVELKKLIEKKDKQLEKDSTELDELIKNIHDKVEKLMTAELEEQEHDIDLEQRHLDNIMLEFDDFGERKNRLLTHLLGRFGERFTADFHIKFNSLMEGESQENIDKKLINLKSTFLKEMVSINKFRSKATNYLTKSAASEVIPLKRKVSLLLDLAPSVNESFSTQVLKDNLKVTRLSSADIQKSTSKKIEYIQSIKQSEKATFLINSSSYYTYLFKYGLKEANYRIESEEKSFIGYFAPPTGETPTKLFSSDTKQEAHQKIESIISQLRNLNAKSEGFHIVEHILLRPLDNNDCYFTIKAKDESVLFKSKEAKPEDAQKKHAIDTILLGCYSNNYRILQNPEKEYVVIIKNDVGLELAKSISSFITERGAQSFIEESINYFNSKKDIGEFDKLYQLDNQKKYYFDILDDQGHLLFQSANALSISEQEQNVEDLTIFTINPACYSSVINSDNTHSVVLNNYDDKEIARSYKKFQNSIDVEKFIENCLNHFEKISSASTYKSIVRFRRADGRNADDFNSQMSVVYSEWSSRFHNQEFLQLFKQTLFNCAPAHIAINMVGLNYQDMQKFEKLYFQYMKELTKVSLENQEALTRLSNDLLSILIDKN